MELNEYQSRAMTTCTASSNNFEYMMLNLVGEVGELASKVAKHIRKEEASVVFNGLMFDSKVMDRVEYLEHMRHLKLEAGDILWQLSGLCSSMGWKLEDIAQMNLSKLAGRKERGTVVGEGDDR